MAFPDGWPPRRASGRRSIRFYKAGTLTANYADNAFLFIDEPSANTFTPVPYIRAGDTRRIHIGGDAGDPYGTSQRAEDGEHFRPNVFQRGFGGGGAEFTRVGTKATGILRGSANAANLDTVTIDTKTYTFQSFLTDVDGNVQIGADLQESLGNLHAAINLEAGAGTKYANSMTIHPTVSSTGYTTADLTAQAKITGVGGNSIATTATGVNLAWDDVTLVGGTGGTYVDLYIPSPSPSFDAGLIGKEVTITGSTSPANDGTFTITETPSGRTLRFENTSAVDEAFPVTGEYVIRFIEEAVPKASIWAGTIRITNKGSNTLYFSFDGENDHGEVPPASTTPTTRLYRYRHEAGIAVKGTAADTFVVEAW
jgi:hypothetical protein